MVRLQSQIIDPIVHWFKPVPPPPKPLPMSTWFYRNYIYMPVYAASDAFQRLTRSVDALDRLNKITLAALQGAQLWFAGESTPRINELYESVSHVNAFFGGVGFFGRVQDMTGVDKQGRPLIATRSSLKTISISFLTVAKAAELGKWLKTCNLLPTQSLHAIDVHYLGGVASRVGSSSLFTALGLTTLSSVKDRFVVLSSTYAILDNVEKLTHLKKWDTQTLVPIWLGIANDIGKIILTLFFRVQWLFIGIAITTASIAVTKILWNSYQEKPLPKVDWNRV